MNYDVIVIGGGAAGLMCALTAGARGRKVLVLEGANKIGKKILMSGGGRCNFTNLGCKPRHFLSSNPRFCISALSRYTPDDFVAMVDRHGIPHHAKTPGQLFCDRSSKDIVAMLRSECDAANVSIVTDSAITHVDPTSDGYRVGYAQGRVDASSLVVAAGGLSIPKMGASDFGYRIARQFGLNVLPTRAGLVPFTFSGALKDMTTRLAGVSVNSRVACGKMDFTDGLLFTHRGMSGPAALQISSYWSPGSALSINLLPAFDDAAWLVGLKRDQPRATLRSVLTKQLPKALVHELDTAYFDGTGERPLADQSDRTLHAAADLLSNWSVKPAATEGYRTAEVTLGGVDTRELSSQTMASRTHPGLYFIGEVVDVTGHLGGYNFQWAWASGHAAGQVA